MIIKAHKIKRMFILLSLLTPLTSTAAVPVWEIVPKDSTIAFTATQNNAPVIGEFKGLTGKINFDPNQLNQSNVEIIVNVNSLTDPYNQLTSTLKDKDWLDAKQFPQAIFRSSNFKKIGDKTYEAKGVLTIRDKALPLAVNFTQETYSPTKARVKGTAIIKRSAFGIGQGEWADTKSVKDEVKIDFTISVVRKS
jgi:polyisoprenoid-binding protein YceI